MSPCVCLSSHFGGSGLPCVLHSLMDLKIIVIFFQSAQFLYLLAQSCNFQACYVWNLKQAEVSLNFDIGT